MSRIETAGAAGLRPSFDITPATRKILIHALDGPASTGAVIVRIDPEILRAAKRKRPLGSG